MLPRSVGALPAGSSLPAGRRAEPPAGLQPEGPHCQERRAAGAPLRPRTCAAAGAPSARNSGALRERVRSMGDVAFSSWCRRHAISSSDSSCPGPGCSGAACSAPPLRSENESVARQQRRRVHRLRAEPSAGGGAGLERGGPCRAELQPPPLAPSPSPGACAPLYKRPAPLLRSAAAPSRGATLTFSLPSRPRMASAGTAPSAACGLSTPPGSGGLARPPLGTASRPGAWAWGGEGAAGRPAHVPRPSLPLISSRGEPLAPGGAHAARSAGHASSTPPAHTCPRLRSAASAWELLKQAAARPRRTWCPTQPRSHAAQQLSAPLHTCLLLPVQCTDSRHQGRAARL